MLLKRVEFAFRRLILGLLRKLGRSPNPLPSSFDVNTAKLLFVRVDRIGDVLVSTPLFEILKKHYPNAILDVLLSRNNHFVLDHHPLIRRRWIYRKRLFSSLKLLFQLRREHYDFVIDLMDNPSTTATVICLIAGARWSVGLDKANAYAYDLTVPLLSRRDIHIVERLAELLRIFRIDPSQEEKKVRYFVSERSAARATHLFEKLGLGGKPVLAINISAGHDTRFWGIDRFRKLVAMIVKTYPEFDILILSKPSDHQRAKDIGQGDPPVRFAPILESFDEFAAVIQRSKLLITPDTSAVHLAAAFGIPSVVLYVQSDKNLRIWDPYGSPTEALVADVDDLSVISPESVLEAMKRLLTRTHPIPSSAFSPTQ